MPEDATLQDEEILHHDQPIIIGGGSIEMEFDGDAFDDVSVPTGKERGRKKWRHRDTRGARLQQVIIKDGGETKTIGIRNRNAVITVKYVTPPHSG